MLHKEIEEPVVELREEARGWRQTACQTTEPYSRHEMLVRADELDLLANEIERAERVG